MGVWRHSVKPYAAAGMLMAVGEKHVADAVRNFSKFLCQWVTSHYHQKRWEYDLRGLRGYYEYHSESMFTPKRNLITWDNLQEMSQGGNAFKFIDLASRICQNRCLFVTTGGFLGLGPANSKLGDIVHILGGANMPIILRPFGGYFGVVGDCFIHGIMDGEAIGALKEGKANGKHVHVQGPVMATSFMEARETETLKNIELDWANLELKRIKIG